MRGLYSRAYMCIIILAWKESAQVKVKVVLRPKILIHVFDCLKSDKSF